jgi:putative hydrolase of the HAD superfamily
MSGVRPTSHAAWLVDLDGTLYCARWLKLMVGLELLVRGVGSIRVLHTFRREHERVRREMADPVDNPYQLQLVRAAARLGKETREVEEIVQRWMIRRPAKWLRLFRRRKLLAEIAAFRRRGGRTAVVSDYPARDKLTALDASQLFDVVLANGEPGGPRRLKPWPDGYLMAAERLGVAPVDCLVLGDRPDADGEAARRAGMMFRRIG